MPTVMPYSANSKWSSCPNTYYEFLHGLKIFAAIVPVINVHGTGPYKRHYTQFCFKGTLDPSGVNFVTLLSLLMGLIIIPTGTMKHTGKRVVVAITLI